MFGSVRRGSLISTYLRQIKSASFAPIKAREGGSRIGAQMQSVKAVTSTAKKKETRITYGFFPWPIILPIAQYPSPAITYSMVQLRSGTLAN